MKCAPSAASALALLALIAASSADSVVPARQKPVARAAGGPQLMAFGGRSAAQRESASAAKLDAALADLSRHLHRVRGERALEDLHALSPAARFIQGAGSTGPLVAIDAVTRGDPARLRQALIDLGLQHPAVYANDVGGFLPVNRIDAAAALGELVAIRASMAHTRAVKVTSQGDFAQSTDTVRTNNPGLTGAGVTVGILSDSFNCYGVYDKPGSGVPASGVRGYAPFGFASDDAAFDETNGYLPASVQVLEEGSCKTYNEPGAPALFLPYADEGRAMMQIVHDVAPGAALAFHTGVNSQADFAAGITALATAGATVIADDIGYYDEPFFQDGIIAQAIDSAVAKGVVYFSAAGNDAQLSYENPAPSFTIAGSGQNAGELLLTFGMNGGPVTALPVTIPPLSPGEFIALILQWDQPFLTGTPPGSPGAASNIDLCVTGANGYTVLNLDGNYNTVTCTGANTRGGDAEQVLVVGNPASNNTSTASQQVHVIIGLKTDGSPAPGLIKLVVADNAIGATIDTFATNSPTLQGHPGAAGAAAVGASWFWQTPRCGTSPAVLAPYSSAGGDPILFSSAGVRLNPVPSPRQKPDFVGPDGGNTSFFGFPLAASADTSAVPQCQNNAAYNNFFGTSAATPHVAAIAALMLQANPALSPAQIVDALQSTAMAMPFRGNPTPDYLSGYGFIQADAALAALPPGPPTMKLASSSITLGSSTTLTWNAYNVSSCSASGSWSGTQQTSGSMTITPMAAGTDDYTLRCSNSHGSAQDKVTLTVQAAPSGGGGGGGGGSLDAVALIALLTLGCARALWPRVARRSLQG
ncbi:MAG TPA: S8 family serine peptidase [Steroidobacteraceae bacterium]|nr:S8 family serine peptidase [Steroidobacteraceae bacterium]